MASFPALPSGNNPAAALAGSFAASAPDVYAQMQAHADRQAAAARQAQLDQAAQDKERFANEQALMKLGGQPAVKYGGDVPPPSNRPTLRRAEPNPAAQGEGQTITEPVSGEPWLVPTEKERMAKAAKDDPSNVVPTGQLANALKVAGWDGTTPLSGAHMVSLMDALGKAQPKDEPVHLDLTGAFKDASGNPTPVMIGEHSGKITPLDLSDVFGGGTQASQRGAAQDATADTSQAALPPPGSPLRGTGPAGMTPAQPQARGGGVTFAPKEKFGAENIIPNEMGPNGGLLRLNPNSGKVEELPLPPGSKQTMTLAQTEADKDRHVRQSELQEARETRKSEADQRRADTQAKVEETYARAHEGAGIKKDNMQAMAKGYWDARGTQPGESYFPPRLVNGIVVPGPQTLMPQKGPEYDARLKDLETTAKGFEKTAKTHQAEQERIEKARGWGKFAPAQQPAAAPVQTAQPAATQPAQPAAATPAAQPAKTTAPAVKEGTIIRNKLGVRLILKGGKWQPAPKAAAATAGQ